MSELSHWGKLTYTSCAACIFTLYMILLIICPVQKLHVTRVGMNILQSSYMYSRLFLLVFCYKFSLLYRGIFLFLLKFNIGNMIKIDKIFTFVCHIQYTCKYIAICTVHLNFPELYACKYGKVCISSQCRQLEETTNITISIIPCPFKLWNVINIMV